MSWGEGEELGRWNSRTPDKRSIAQSNFMIKLETERFGLDFVVLACKCKSNEQPISYTYIHQDF